MSTDTTAAAPGHDSRYTLALKTPQVTTGGPAELRFAVLDGAGRPVTAYRQVHGKELHLIVASRDLTVYRHLHPARAADGTWSAVTRLPHAGTYRLFADFAPEDAEAGLTLGADFAATGGTPQPGTLPEPHHTARVDGYEVRLAGRLHPEGTSHLTLRVARDGKPVRDLQPYLGAYGHLVALRADDLAYLHVHPHGEPDDGRTPPGPDVSFMASVPEAGAYRLFFDFQHEGRVRTAAFTVTASPEDAPPAAGAAHGHASHAHGHQH